MKRLICVLSIFLVLSLQASDFKIAVGSGYKKPFLKIIKLYKKTYDSNIEVVFGNSSQITNQAKQTDISFVFGDKNYFANKSGLDIVKYVEVGQGKLILAYTKNIKLKSYKDITSKNIKKMAMPNSKKTVYGKSVKDFLKNSNLYKDTKDKILMVSTAPQVATYLIANEIDAGFLNLTAYKANEKKLGGYIEIPQKFYSKISIVAGVLTPCYKNKECAVFLEFLQSHKSKEIFKKFGLQ